MRKSYLILASALLCATAAQAQNTPIVTGVEFYVEGQTNYEEDGVTVENSYLLPSVDAVVNIKLHDYNPNVAAEGDWKPFIVWTKGTGFAIDQDFEYATFTGENTCTFTLDKEKWGNPYVGNYYVNLMLCFVNADMDFYFGADGEPVMFSVAYITPNVFPATFLYAYPDGEWQAGDSFAKTYKPTGEGCSFNFNNIVDFGNNDFMGTIVYNRVSEEPAIEFISLSGNPETVTEENKTPTGKASVGYNPLDGNYVVSVHYYNPSIAADEISSIEIELMGMTSMGTDIENEKATINNDATNPNVQQMPKSRLAEGLGVANESVDVYNMQGMLVKANVNKSTIQDLPAGLYIVDGKKVIIR